MGDEDVNETHTVPETSTCSKQRGFQAFSLLAVGKANRLGASLLPCLVPLVDLMDLELRP